ncbi:hypothetical protein FQN60_003980 [Etheostoma spectabile]|uniref:Uncharacterized protein n=1 Tax=Etheostoma spectabile TaxID=54343 RepID=A0A5J5CX85_9PERO|nr:hypothetical protein FQN60_003980 [Etheostoma spectabile]
MEKTDRMRPKSWQSRKSTLVSVSFGTERSGRGSGEGPLDSHLMGPLLHSAVAVSASPQSNNYKIVSQLPPSFRLPFYRQKTVGGSLHGGHVYLPLQRLMEQNTPTFLLFLLHLPEASSATTKPDGMALGPLHLITLQLIRLIFSINFHQSQDVCMMECSTAIGGVHHVIDESQ